MIANSTNYVKGEDYKALKATLGDGLVTLIDDATHSAHRRIINPAFSPVALKEIADSCMRHHALEMLQRLRREINESGKQNESFRTSVRRVVNRPALEIIADAAFHTGPHEVSRVAGHFQTILTAGAALGVLNILPVIRMLPLPSKIQRNAAMRDLSRFLCDVRNVVRSSVPLSQSDAAFEGKAIIDYLVHSNSFTEAQMLDHSLTFMFAGHETSSNTIQWIVLLLSNNLDIQDRLFDELSCVMSTDTCPELADLQKCKFLAHVIKEGMRLYPVAPIILREAVEDDVLPFSKAVVPKRSSVTINIFACQRHPDIYGADADVFRPSRWEDPSLAQKIEPCGWMPFSVGKRNCIGKDFAWNEISIIVAVLVRNYRITFPPNESLPKRRVGVTLSTREPYDVFLAARQ
jgi:cytochrome P450